MNASSYLSFLRTMRAAREVGSRQRQNLERALILYWIWQTPWASVGDLVSHGLLTAQRVSELLTPLADSGYVVACSLCSTRYRQRRYALTLKGTRFVRERFRLDLAWQVTREGLERLSRYAPFLELAYPLAPRLWRSTAVQPLRYKLTPDPERDDEVEFGGQTLIYSFIWVSNDQVHALGRYVNPSGDEVTIPFVWYGSQHGARPLGDGTLRSVFRGLVLPDHPDYTGAPASPAGVVVLCADGLAALRVQRQFAPDIPRAVITSDKKVVVETLRPVPPRGRFRMIEQPAGRIGVPDGIRGWLADSPHGETLSSAESNRIFRWVEWYQGSLTSHVAMGAKVRNDMARQALDLMIQHDLVVELEKGFYLGNAGITFVSQRDRIHIQTVKSLFATYIAEDGKYRRQQRRHDRGVAKLAIRFQKLGLVAVPGRRMVLNFPDLTQIKPDLWVAVPRGDGSVLWIAVELEYSAKDDGKITSKVVPYRLALFEAGEAVPCAVVTGTPEAAQRFTQLGDDLPMLSALEKEFHKGSLQDRMWHWRGQCVPLSHLLTLAQGDGLIQRTDRKLEYWPSPPGLRI